MTGKRGSDEEELGDGGELPLVEEPVGGDGEGVVPFDGGVRDPGGGGKFGTVEDGGGGDNAPPEGSPGGGITGGEFAG